MTERRFTINGKEIIQGKQVWCMANSEHCADVIATAMNELHEENQALHKTIDELDNCQKGQSHRINDLCLENKQLKDLITHLGYTIKYDGYRHISLELKR